MAAPLDPKVTPTEQEINSAANKSVGANATNAQGVIPPTGKLEQAVKDVKTDVEIIISNFDQGRTGAIKELQDVRARIDKLIGPPFWQQVWSTKHKILIVTVFLTVLGMAGSALGLVAGYASEKDRAAYVLAGSLLSLVGNTVSSATGIFVPAPVLKKGDNKTTAELNSNAK